MCPLFLGQSVPVTLTDQGYVLFCEVCELGHGPVVLHIHDPAKLKMHMDPAEETDPAEDE